MSCVQPLTRQDAGHSSVHPGPRRADARHLEVTVDDTGVRIERVAAGLKLVRMGKRLVARPTMPWPDLDEFIDDHLTLCLRAHQASTTPAVRAADSRR